MIIFRKYISYILLFSFMAINAMYHTFSASAESNISICTNEGIKYLLADGSLSDSKNNKIYHDGCMACITCDNSFYKKEKLTFFLLNTAAKHKYNLFKVNFDKYTLIHHKLIRGPPALS